MFPCDKATGYLRTVHFLEGGNASSIICSISYEFCISQGTAATFFRCGGQVKNHLCRFSSGFRVPKIIHIGLFLTELFKKLKCGHFFGHNANLILPLLQSAAYYKQLSNSLSSKITSLPNVMVASH